MGKARALHLHNAGWICVVNGEFSDFICVFKCTIVNLATYRQFTNAAGDWIIYKKKNQKNKTKNKQTKTKQKPEKKISKLH